MLHYPLVREDNSSYLLFYPNLTEKGSDAGGTGWAIGRTLEPGIDHTLPAGAAKFEDG